MGLHNSTLMQVRAAKTEAACSNQHGIGSRKTTLDMRHF